MATQDRRTRDRADEPDEADDPGLPAPAAQARDTGTDDVLDEIDAVLESNAEEFVRGFVQKGGQ